MQEIMLRNMGLVAFVDDKHYARLSKRRWHAVADKNTFYAVHSFKVGAEIRHIKMHREVLRLKPGDGVVVDHLDGNGLNNLEKNLRKATRGQNCRNRKANRSCEYKGVRPTGSGTWRARIQADRKRIELGTYNSPAEAAWAYDKAAMKIHGKFARLNFAKNMSNSATGHVYGIQSPKRPNG
jgi:hypothetical protein